MGDSDEASKRWAWIELNRIAAQRGNLPCPYGGGNCLITGPGIKTNQDDGNVYNLLACSRAKMAQDGLFGKARSERELRAMGCPRPESAFFSGWKCKFADGKAYPL
jgi:hypothetical protein